MKPHLIFALVLLLANFAGCTPHSVPPSETEYLQWQKDPENARKASELRIYLSEKGVADVFPPQQLLSSDVMWRLCMADQFNVPPKKDWPHIVQTLRLVKSEIISLVGKVEALSVYRSPPINRCIHGASQSFHLSFHAIDMQTKDPISRAHLIEKLCRLHRNKGKSLNMGLGIYTAQRFHIDAAGYRTWGNDYRSSSSPCRSLIAPQHKSR
jgi:hypothetical protein